MRVRTIFICTLHCDSHYSKHKTCYPVDTKNKTKTKHSHLIREWIKNDILTSIMGFAKHSDTLLLFILSFLGCITHRHKQFWQFPWGQWWTTTRWQLRMGHRLLMSFLLPASALLKTAFSETQLPANLREREKTHARGHRDAFDRCCSSNYSGIRTYCLDDSSALYMFSVWT